MPETNHSYEELYHQCDDDLKEIEKELSQCVKSCDVLVVD